MSKQRPSDLYFGSPDLQDPASPPEQQVNETGPDGISLEFLTAALRDRHLADDIAAAGSGSGRFLFHGWLEKVTGALNDAYAPYLHMLKGGPKAVEQVLRSPKFPARDRIHRNKPALIALQLAARPRGEAQVKACSEYAPFLQCAALRQIPPEDFAERMASVKLKDAKATIRAERKAARSASRETGAPQTDEVPPPAPEKAPKVLEGTPEVWTQIVEPSNPPSDSEAARNPHPPNQSPATTSSPATAPKKVDATTDARVKSPVIG